MTDSGSCTAPLPGRADGSHRRLANLRDAAGLRLTSGVTIPAGILYRSDAPYPGDAVPETVPVWPPATVIDLRTPDEAAAAYPWPAGVSVHHLSLLTQEVLAAAGTGTARPSRQPLTLETLYRLILQTVPRQLASLVAIAADSAGPVLVHCTAGKDRTGIAVAVLLLAGGAEPADVVADYTATAPNMSALLERLGRLGRSLPAGVSAKPELLAAPTAAIIAVVDQLTGWPGGSQAWAEAHGAPAGALRRWQDRLAAGERGPAVNTTR